MKRRAAILFFGTVFGLLLATVLVLQSKPFEEWVGRQIVREAYNRLNAHVTLGKPRIRILSLQPGVELFDLTITPRVPSGRPPFREPTIRADRVRIVLRPLQLMAKRLDVDRIELDGLHLDLDVRKGKLVGLPTGLESLLAPSDGASSSATSIKARLDAFLVKNGTFHFTSDEPKLELGLTRIRALGTIEANGSVVVDFETGGRRLRMNAGEADLEEMISELSGQLVVRKDVLEIRGVKVVAGDIAGDATGVIGLRGGTDVKLSALHLVLPLEYANAVAPNIPTLGGVLTWNGTLSVVGRSVRARGNAKVPDLRLDKFKLGDADADIDLAGTRARAKRMVLAMAGGRIEGTAEMNWGGAQPPGTGEPPALRLGADVMAHDLSFARIMDAVGIEGAHVDARVSGPVQFEGPLAPIELAGSARLSHEQFTWRDRPWNESGPMKPNLRVPSGRLGGKFVVHGEGLRFIDLEGSAGSSQIAGGGELLFEGSTDISVSCAPLALGEISPIGSVILAGTGPAKARVHGRLNALVIESDLDLDGVKVGGFDFGHGTGKVVFQDLVLSSPRTTFLRGTSTYAGPWKFDFHQPISLGFEVETRESRIEDLADILWSTMPASAHVQGEVSGTIQLSGPLDALSGSYQASAAQVTIEGERFSRLTARGRWNRGTIWADDLVATKKSGAQIYARGSLAPPIAGEEALGGPVNVELHTSSFALSDLTRMGDDPAVTSEVALRLHVGGRFQAPELRGRADLSGTRVNGAALAPSQVLFETGPSAEADAKTRDLMTVDARIAGGTVRAQGRLRLRGELPFEIDLEAKQHSVKPYLLAMNPLLSREDDVTGTTSGTFRVTGTLVDPGNSEISGRITDVKLTRGPHQIRNPEPIVLSFGGGKIDVREFHLTGDETDFTLKGSRSPDGTQDFRAHGDIDLAFLPLLTDAFRRVEGVLRVRALTVGGRKGATRLTGHAELERGVFKNRFFTALNLEDVKGRLRFTQDEIVFEQVVGRANGGVFEVPSPGGRSAMRLDGPAVRRWDLSARLTDVPVRFASQGFAARGSGDLVFEGPSSNPILSGSLRLSEARYTAPFDWKAKAVGFGRGAGFTNAAVEEARIFGLNLYVRADDNVWVKNELLNVEWRISDEDPIRLVGDTAEWGLQGTLESIRGKAVFQGDREFAVTSGTVRFFDPRRVDADYDVTAETLVRDWQVDARITGRISTGPLISYDSTPPLSTEDITFLLLAGLTKQEAEGQDAAVAVGIFSSVAVQGIGEQRGLTSNIKKVIPLDAVEVVPSYSEGGQFGFKAIGRKQVNPDLTVSASVGHAGQDRTTGNFQADYRVNKRLHLVGGWNNEDDAPSPGELLNQGDVSVDAKFRFEWE